MAVMSIRVDVGRMPRESSTMTSVPPATIRALLTVARQQGQRVIERLWLKVLLPHGNEPQSRRERRVPLTARAA